MAIDYDMGTARSEPATPLATQALGWVEAAFRAAGANPRIGARLVPMLRAAGFADVETFGVQAYLTAHDRPGPALLSGVVASLQGAIVGHGIATEAEIGIDTLEERLRQEIAADDAVLLAPTVAGAWGRG